MKEHEHKHHCDEHNVAHCVVKNVKLALKVASVVALFCVAKEIHRVHKAIEAHK